MELGILSGENVCGLSPWVVTVIPFCNTLMSYTKGCFLGAHCICAEEAIHELSEGEAEILREPEGVLMFLCETKGIVLGFISRMEEDHERQGKRMVPEAGGTWWTLISTLKQLKQLQVWDECGCYLK